MISEREFYIRTVLYKDCIKPARKIKKSAKQARENAFLRSKVKNKKIDGETVKVSVSPPQALLTLAKKRRRWVGVLSVKPARLIALALLYALIIRPEKLKFGKIIALNKNNKKF